MNRETSVTETLLTQSVTIDGTTVRYGIHRGGLRHGQLHTLIGDFANMDELERYVRGRNGSTRSEPGEKLEVWPGVYNPSNPSRRSDEDSGDGPGHGAGICNCQDPHGPTCGEEPV